MKKIALLLFVVIAFSCSKSPEEIIKTNVGEYLKPKLNDPESYEFVEMGKIDTITRAKKATLEMYLYKKMLSGKDEKLDFLTKEVEAGKQLVAFNKKYQGDLDIAVVNYEKAVKEFGTYQVKADSLSDIIESTNANDIEFFETKVKIRGINNFGAKILTTYLVRLDNKLSVVFAKNSDN